MIMVSKGRKSLTSWSVDRMLSLYAFLLCSSLLYCSAIDARPFNNSIADERGETVISAGETFELGFFTPNEDSSRSGRYVGIWYYNLTPLTVVWVANRDSPLTDHNGSFTITEDGNLKVLDGEGVPNWSTGLSKKNKTNASLMDSGNLILMDDTTAETLWESFSNPTDTFLPGMKMDQGLNLTSWNTSDNPAPGYFMFLRGQSEGQFEITNDTLPYWKSDAGQMLPEIANLLSNLSTINSVSLAAVVSEQGTRAVNSATKSVSDCGRGMAYSQCLGPRGRPTYSVPTTPTNVKQNDSSTRLVISFSGVIQYLRLDGEKNWSTIWFQPTSRCGASNTCGNFGSCNSNNGLQLCKCLPGFEPNSMEYSGGCKRQSAICGESDAFLSLKMMRVREPNKNFTAANENECRDMHCQRNCKCLAYSYDNSTRPCKIWTEDLTNIQEEYAFADGGRNLSVRVNGSDIDQSTVKDCKPCGTYTIPYPLSTGTDCGDPMYMNFECNISSGQVSFKAAPNRTSYRVTNIYPNAQKFVILQPKGAGNCEAQNSGGNILKPFQANDWCRGDKGDSSPDRSSQGGDEIEISWDPPPEPICKISSPADCKDWKNSTCKEARDGRQRCLCNAHFSWNSLTLSCVQGPSPWKMSRPLIIATAIVPIALICTIVCYLYLRRRRAAKRKENMRKTQQNQALQFCDNELHGKDWIASNQFREEDKKHIDVPFFDLESILAATNNFSDENKLGRGGFGPVYKGKFPGGREIAVKRLLSISGQGLEEFKNEVILIAKLQHRNLVRLLGYCIKGEEKLLLYEYMPNKSLDTFIFDRTPCMVLDWELRFNIILGIARGLLYLHQDSRLKIIHRDLKTSNILLDGEMNPKISDFGLAKIFGGKQNEANTNRIVGTYGYMSPEYALEGVFSDKSDVFSFGVVVLEIISGKRNTRSYQSEQALSLLGYAWRLWNEDNALDLMDQSLRETCNTNEFIKCINVGLLCVQEDPSDRPTMSNVVFMLGSETATLPTPNQPAFIVRRGPSSTASTSSGVETCSNNKITITLEEGR